MIPDLVPIEDLPGAIALGSAQWNLGRVIGPLLAGITISLGGISWAFGHQHRQLLRGDRRAPPHHAAAAGTPTRDAVKILASIRSGFRFVRADAGLRIVIQTMSLNTLLAAPFIALVPAMAIKVLDSGKFGTSVLVTAQGIGAVAAALAIGPLGRRHGMRWIMVRSVGVGSVRAHPLRDRARPSALGGRDPRRRRALPRVAVDASRRSRSNARRPSSAVACSR